MKLEKRKAMGRDGLAGEVLQALDDESFKLFATFYRQALKRAMRTTTTTMADGARM